MFIIHFYLLGTTFAEIYLDVCQIGREREVAVCLMQKYIDKRAELQIRSAIALDHLKNYIYVEADKEAHVREVCYYEDTCMICNYLPNQA